MARDVLAPRHRVPEVPADVGQIRHQRQSRRGPLGSGMEETYQVTSALKHLKWGKQVAVLTDARFSGVSTGACVGHITPEALAGGPIGRLRDGDRIQIVIDRTKLEGTINLIGDEAGDRDAAWGTAELATRPPRPDLAPDPQLPADTRLWAALQHASGGVWGGCVYDADAVAAKLMTFTNGMPADARPATPRPKA